MQKACCNTLYIEARLIVRGTPAATVSRILWSCGFFVLMMILLGLMSSYRDLS